MSRAVRPYLVAAQETASFAGWSVARGGHAALLPDVLPDWDYNTDLALSGVLEIDRHGLVRSTGIEHDDELRATVSWRSVDGRIGATVVSKSLGEQSRLALDPVLSGADLGPEIDIWVRLVLRRDVQRDTPGAARLAGSVLWEHSTRLVLVGDAARFPVSVIDFRSCGLDPDAGWVLQLPDRLDSPVLGELILLINSRDVELVQALTSASPDDRQVQVVFEEITVDLLNHGVDNVEALADEALVPGTFGAVLIALMNRVPGGAKALEALRDQHPARYRALLAGEARRSGARGALA